MTPKQKKDKLLQKAMEVVTSQEKAPDLKSLAHHILSEMGGIHEFAKEVVNTYRESPKGGMTKTRAMDIMLRCVSYAIEKDTPKEDLQGISQDDLTRLSKELLENLSNGIELEQQTSETEPG